MAKAKDKKRPAEERRSAEDYYKLHSQAVKDLATANEENSPVVSEAELRKYRSGSKIRISETLKAVLIKFWFNGSVCPGDHHRHPGEQHSPVCSEDSRRQ